jgi:hypothetical protein
MEVLKNTTILAFMPPNSRYQTLSRFSFNGYASWATGIVELAAGLIGFAAKHVSAEPPAIVYVLDTVCRVCHTLKEPVCHIAARALDLRPGHNPRNIAILLVLQYYWQSNNLRVVSNPTIPGHQYY